MKSPLERLWHHIPSLRKRQFVWVLVLMILASFAEMLSIGAVLPFLAVLTNPSKIFENPSLKPLIHLLQIDSPNGLLFPLTIFFAIAVVLAAFMRLALLKRSLAFSFATGSDLGFSIYRRTLYQPYAVHVSRNTSQLIDGITSKTTLVTDGILMPLLYIASSLVMMIVIISTLLLIAPGTTLAAFGSFAFIYIFIGRMTRKRLTKNSQYIAQESTVVIKSLQEGLGGIRDVLIDGTQEGYCQIYKRSDSLLRDAYATSQYIGAAPRFGVEALGMLVIMAIAYFLSQQDEAGGIVSAIPILGLLALAAQRLVPVMQITFQSWVRIKSNQDSLIDALNFLDQPLPEYLNDEVAQPIIFKKSISLKEISFRYQDDAPWVIEGLNLDIVKGSQIGFIGTTGSGKSTLLDIIMGLLEPTKGSFTVDGQLIKGSNMRSWQLHIAHVPQAIFLADSSIAENIAFGVPAELINYSRVQEVAEVAQLADLIETLPDKYKTTVGERGVRLSGGQRQRIGIARALYKNVDVIVLDEATSALDGETELAVMKAIEAFSKNLTVLIIAHRLSTLRNCSSIIELARGQIRRVGTYAEIVG
jgi:ABC-type multidrug transport system fused ATPase/permease subunit